MKKKIAILIKDRPAEALRMGLGLTILNDQIDIYFLRTLDETIKDSHDLSLMKELGVRIYTISDEETGSPKNTANSGGGRSYLEFITLSEAAKKFLDYDLVVPY